MSARSYRWKTLQNNYASWDGQVPWKVNVWQPSANVLVLDKEGYHAFPRIIEAMISVWPGVIAKAEVAGESMADRCWSEMRIVQTWPWTINDSAALAQYADNQVYALAETPHLNAAASRTGRYAAKAVRGTLVWDADETWISELALSAIKAAVKAVAGTEVWEDAKVTAAGQQLLSSCEQFIKSVLKIIDGEGDV